MTMYVRMPSVEEVLARPRPLMMDVARAVAHKHQIPVSELLGHCREHHLIVARDEFVLICRDKMKKSFPQIGKIMNRDHTTVLHYWRRVVSAGKGECSEDYRQRTKVIFESKRERTRMAKQIQNQAKQARMEAA